jgi:hypothetical protein
MRWGGITDSIYSTSSVSSYNPAFAINAPPEHTFLGALTSPTPFSAHQAPRLARRSSPATRKSNGTGAASASALFTSCESWKRRQPVGIMNFCAGSAYAVFVVNTTGIDGSVLLEDAIVCEGWLCGKQLQVPEARIFE